MFKNTSSTLRLGKTVLSEGRLLLTQRILASHFADLNSLWSPRHGGIALAPALSSRGYGACVPAFCRYVAEQDPSRQVLLRCTTFRCSQQACSSNLDLQESACPYQLQFFLADVMFSRCRDLIKLMSDICTAHVLHLEQGNQADPFSGQEKCQGRQLYILLVSHAAPCGVCTQSVQPGNVPCGSLMSDSGSDSETGREEEKEAKG